MAPTSIGVSKRIGPASESNPSEAGTCSSDRNASSAEACTPVVTDKRRRKEADGPIKKNGLSWKKRRADKYLSILIKAFISLLLFLLLLFTIFYFGIRWERSRVLKAKSTKTNYYSTSVCARTQYNGSAPHKHANPMEQKKEKTHEKSNIFSFVTFTTEHEISSMISNNIVDKNGADVKNTRSILRAMPSDSDIGSDVDIDIDSARTSSIAHCGDCGSCSTDTDIQLMIATKDTLTKDATRCAIMGFIPVVGEEMIDECLQDIGFTPGCSTCWKDNIQCTMANCKFTCLKAKFLSEPNNSILSISNSSSSSSSSSINKDADVNNHTGDTGTTRTMLKLNECLECDEKLCGPNFLHCAGANRRRLGIVSDIARDDDEQCSKATFSVEDRGRSVENIQIGL